MVAARYPRGFMWERALWLAGRHTGSTAAATQKSSVQALIPRIHGLLLQANNSKGMHEAWLMLTNVAMDALDYDAKLAP